MLERTTPPETPAGDDEPEATAAAEPTEGEPAAAAKGRGAKPRAVGSKLAARVKGRTVYIPDDLFERIIVQAHRREKTISEYVVAILERQVPDHRVIRAEPPAEAGAA